MARIKQFDLVIREPSIQLTVTAQLYEKAAIWDYMLISIETYTIIIIEKPKLHMHEISHSCQTYTFKLWLVGRRIFQELQC